MSGASSAFRALRTAAPIVVIALASARGDASRASQHGPESPVSASRPVAGGTIEGVVLGDDDRPLPNASVTAYPMQLRLGAAMSSVRARSDAEGRFRFSGLEAGRWHVRGRSDTSPAQPLTAPVTVVDAGVAQVRLAPWNGGCTVRGHLLQGGQPLARVEFALRLISSSQVDAARRASADASESSVMSDTSDTDGSFVLRRVPPGVYSAIVSKPRNALEDVLDLGITFTIPRAAEHRLDVELSNYAGVSGRVVARPDGRPLAGVRIRVEGISRGELPWPANAYLRTDVEGRFSIRGFVAGSYEILVGETGDRSLKTDGVELVPARIPVDLVNGSVVPLEIALDRGCSVVAHVLDASGAAAPGARVQLAWADARLEHALSSLGWLRSGQTDEQGVATLAGIARGRYVVVAKRGDTWTVSEEFEAQPERASQVALQLPKAVPVRIHAYGPDAAAIHVDWITYRNDRHRGSLVHPREPGDAGAPRWLDVPLSPGTYTVVVGANGYAGTPHDVTITDDPSQSITVTLAKIPPPPAPK